MKKKKHTYFTFRVSVCHPILTCSLMLELNLLRKSKLIQSVNNMSAESVIQNLSPKMNHKDDVMS